MVASSVRWACWWASSSRPTRRMDSAGERLSAIVRVRRSTSRSIPNMAPDGERASVTPSVEQDLVTGFELLGADGVAVVGVRESEPEG